MDIFHKFFFCTEKRQQYPYLHRCEVHTVIKFVQKTAADTFIYRYSTIQMTLKEFPVLVPGREMTVLSKCTKQLCSQTNTYCVCISAKLSGSRERGGKRVLAQFGRWGCQVPLSRSLSDQNRQPEPSVLCNSTFGSKGVLRWRVT